MMALQQLWEKMFMNWNLSALERGNFRRVIVHGDHLMTEFRETCCGNQTDVSRANQSNAHHSSSAIGTPTKKAGGRSTRHDCVSQAAPEPFTTAGIVLAKIFRSSQSDHSSRYWMSSSIHCSNAMELRPCTCHKQVIPGLTLNRRRCQSSLNP